MKKLIAISVVFALIAGAAFALEISAGGAVTATLIEGNSEFEEIFPTWGGSVEFPRAGGVEGWWWISGSKTNDDETAGAEFGFNSGWEDLFHDDNYFRAWWRPIDQLIIKLGHGVADFAGANITGWGFQSNDLLLDPGFDYYNGYAGGLLSSDHGFFAPNDTNLFIGVSPMDGLSINLGFNIGGDLEDSYLNSLSVQFVYEIPGAGTAAIGFANGETFNIAAQYSQGIGDMSFELGVNFGYNTDTELLSPLDIGIGFMYGSPWGDDFWLSARVGVSIAMENNQVTTIGLGICPSYDLGVFRFYFPIGISMQLPDGADAVVAWSINPYIRKQMGGIEFWAGIQVYSGISGFMNGATGSGGLGDGEWYPMHVADAVHWAIPIGFLWAW